MTVRGTFRTIVVYVLVKIGTECTGAPYVLVKIGSECTTISYKTSGVEMACFA